MVKKIIFSLLFIFSVQLSNAQNNSVKRIDSLTHAFMQGTTPKQKIILTPDELNNLTEERFNELVSTLGSTIDFKYNDVVKTQIGYMKNPASTFLSKACGRKDIYFRIFENILDKKGMPDEIKYLSIVESLLSPNAVSWCGATGLWQFMPATGRMMDLRIDNEVDERKDIYKSTEKACDYLQSNYNRFGDWLLALASYNGGPGNVNKAIARSGGKKTFWEIKPYLPKETQNYVPKFIATVFLMSFYPPLEESANKLEAHEMVVPVNVCCPIDMKYISAVINISEYEQLEWNSVYRGGIIPQFVNNKTVILPYEKAMQLCQFQDSIYLISANSFNPENYIKYETYTTIHKVKKGETTTQIADIYNIYSTDIKRWNRLKSNKLKAGTSLKIIKSREVVLPLSSNENKEFFFYITTFESQTIYDICNKFTEFDTIKICQINGIESTQTPLGKGKIIKLYTKSN